MLVDLKASDELLDLDRREKKRPQGWQVCLLCPCHTAWWPMEPCLLDGTSEPQRRPPHDSQEGYSLFSAGELRPTPPRSCLAEREPFCLRPRKKSTKRTSLGTNKGTSLGFYPKKVKKKKGLTHRNKLRTPSSFLVARPCGTSALGAMAETRDKLQS